MRLGPRLQEALDMARSGHAPVCYMRKSMERLAAEGLVKRDGRGWVTTRKGDDVAQSLQDERWRRKLKELDMEWVLQNSDRN